MRSRHFPSLFMRWSLIAGAALLLLTVAGAADSPPAPPDKASGRILAVDAIAKSVRVGVSPPGGGGDPVEVDLVVNEQTKILKDAKVIALDDLKVGDSVMVSYRSSGGSNVAIAIVVQAK